MKRREFISLICSAAATWPLGARAQSAIPVIGYMDTASATTTAHLVDAFRRGFSAAGYDEGRNVAIEYRWADGDYDKLPALAAELVRLQVAVIATINTPTILAAKAATQSIPIIFGVGVDPIKFGLVASLNHPGGNLTGVTQLNIEIEAKQVQLLHDLAPSATTIAFLINPTSTAYSEAATEICPGRGARSWRAPAGPECKHRECYRGRFCQACGGASRLDPGERRLILGLQARSNSCAGGAARCARAISPTRVHGYWWTDELRTQPS
jgi:ABC transporter substrate binding protein